MFCEATTVTREHIFTRGISTKFPPRPIMIPRFRFQGNPESLPPQEQRKYIRRGGDHALAITSLCMCESCNNELGKELSPLSGRMVKLFKAETNTISSDLAYGFLRYFHRIGAIVDLETSSVGTLPATESQDDTIFNRNYHTSPPMISEEARREFRAGGLLQNIAVHIGRHHGSYGKSYAMNLMFSRPPSRTETYYKGFTFSIDRFTCLVEIGPSTLNRNEKLSKIELDGTDIRLSPSKISTDADVRKNYAPVDVYPNESFVPAISIGSIGQQA